MKKLFTLTFAIFIVSTGLFAQTKAGKVDTAQHTTFYTCPKHSDVVSHQPGKCPTCGMVLNRSIKEQMKTAAAKNYICPVHLEVVCHDPGQCPKCGKKLSLSPKEQMKAAATKAYTCPMHPEVALNTDGVCPKCGKDLVKKKQKN